ncbi:MAG TPA: hypothetical protein VFG11_01400, partial [Acidobacteriota bacterium]|nr:hypothetical protein [Acidobacteriota bacterium]
MRRVYHSSALFDLTLMIRFTHLYMAGTNKSLSARLIAVLSLGALLLLAAARVPAPPQTKKDGVVDTIHGVQFTDHYRWLEDQQNPETRKWLDAQNA